MRGKPYSYSDFRGGLNTRDAVYIVPPNQARDLLNVTGTTHGSVKRRRGTQLFSSPANPLTSLYGVESIAPRCLIAADPTAGVFRSIDTAGTVASLGGTTGTERWKFVSAAANAGQGPVYGMNGVQAPVQWAGGATVAAWTAATGTLPNGRHMVYAGNRLWVVGMTTHGALANPGSYVVFSNIGNPRDWPAANVVGFDPGDGQDITGVGTVGPYVLVFKPNKVWVVYDLDTGANRSISQNVGCVAPDSIVETPYGAFFLHDSGVYSTTGQNVKKMSDIVTPTIEQIPETRIDDAQAAFVDDHLYLAITTAGGVNNRLLDYDFALESWWLHSITAGSMAVWRPLAEPRLYVADPTVARVGRAFEPALSTDYGAAFEDYWDQGWVQPSAGGSVIRHRLRQMRCDVSGRVSFYLARDFQGDPEFQKEFDFTPDPTTFGGAGSFGGDGTYGDPAFIKQGKAPTLGVVRAFSARFGSTHGEPWELQQFAMAITDRAD